MFNHKNTLHELDKNIPLGEKLASIHQATKKQFEFIDRIAIAIYDEKTDLLKTYLSSGGQTPLKHYQSTLSESGSLQEIIAQRRHRVVNELSIISAGTQKHTQDIKEKGYASNSTLPLTLHDLFFVFVFFN